MIAAISLRWASEKETAVVGGVGNFLPASSVELALVVASGFRLVEGDVDDGPEGVLASVAPVEGRLKRRYECRVAAWKAWMQSLTFFV